MPAPSYLPYPCSGALSSPLMDSDVLSDILAGRVPPSLFEILQQDQQALETTLSSMQDTPGAGAGLRTPVPPPLPNQLDPLTPGQASRGGPQVRVPTILAVKAPKDRWGYFRMLAKLVPYVRNNVKFRQQQQQQQQPTTPRSRRKAKLSATCNLLSGKGDSSAYMEQLLGRQDSQERLALMEHDEQEVHETWYTLIQKRKKKAYYNKLMRMMAAKMDFYRRHWAARTIQRAWRTYKNDRSGKASNELELLRMELARRRTMELALRQAADEAFHARTQHRRLAKRMSTRATSRRVSLAITSGWGLPVQGCRVGSRYHLLRLQQQQQQPQLHNISLSCSPS